MGTELSSAKGCLSCEVPDRATALSSPRLSWSRLKRSPGKGLARTSCGNGLHWCCSCSTNRLCPTSKSHDGCSCICGRCSAGATGGPPGPSPWKTSQDGAAKRSSPPLDHARIKALACERVAETHQPL